MLYIKKPMLAGTVKDLKDIKLPCKVSPKLDGIRALTVDGKLLSRTFKPIPNLHINEELKNIPDGFDGELITFSPEHDPYDHPDRFNDVSSKVMKEEGEPTFLYYVFDYLNPRRTANPYPFRARYEEAQEVIAKKKLPFVHIVNHTDCYSVEDILRQEHNWVTDGGFEGIMIRDPEGPYKFGRSTLKEGYLLKFKRFQQEEAVVTAVEELMVNKNEAEKDAFGRTKRSSHQDNLVPGGTMGSLVLDYKGKQFSVGTGFDAALRASIWADRKKTIGRIVTFKFQELSEDGIPRFPVFIGFRDKRDM